MEKYPGSAFALPRYLKVGEQVSIKADGNQFSFASERTGVTHGQEGWRLFSGKSSGTGTAVHRGWFFRDHGLFYPAKGFLFKREDGLSSAGRRRDGVCS